MRSTDTLARFGGDEFVAACEDLGGAEDAERIAAHMIAAVDKQWTIDGQVIPDLSLAKSRPSRHLPSLSTRAAHLAGLPSD